MMVMQRDPIQDVPTSARMAEISFGVGGRSQLHGMDATTLAARLTEKNVPISRATGKARRVASLSCAPVVLGLDLAGVVVAVGHGVSGLEVSDAVAAMTGLNCDGGWVAAGGNGRGEGGYAVARQFLTAGKPPSLSFRDAAALPMAFLSAFAGLYRAVQAGDTVLNPQRSTARRAACSSAGWLWRWSGRRRDLWSRMSARPSTALSRRSIRDCSR